MKRLKSISIGLVLFCFVISVKGQTEQGKVLLGGETKFAFSAMSSKYKTDHDTRDDGNLTNIEFSPQIGFFVADGLALGVEIPVMYSSEKDDEGDKSSSTSLAFAPFFRYYFGTSNVKPYLHGQAGFGNLKSTVDLGVFGTHDASFRMFLYEIGGGVGIFLNEKVSLDIGLGYGSVTITSKDDEYRSVSSGIGLGIGIVVVL